MTLQTRCLAGLSEFCAAREDLGLAYSHALQPALVHLTL